MTEESATPRILGGTLDIPRIPREKIVEFLSDPQSYDHKPKSVTHLQTHVSDVFIASPYVFKLKKPVDLGFLDFTTLEKRRHFCMREVELNSRLSDFYIGVVEIGAIDGKLLLGQGGDAVDYVVNMRELDERFFLINLLEKGEIRDEHLSRVVGKLVDFYTLQEPGEEILEYGKPEKIRVNIDENFDQCKDFVGITITPAAYDTIKLYNDLFFAHNAGLLEKRIEEGRIRDCHGDLHLAHIHITPSVVNIYDCIEFNDRFRYLDLACDVAFLAMDFDYHGRPDLGARIVAEFSKRLKDDTLLDVMDLYKCYRAYVRGKVDTMKALQDGVPEEEKKVARDTAKRYFSLSLSYSLFGSDPLFIVAFGVIGSGKTTISKAVSAEIDAEVISSDRVRKELAGIDPEERRYVEFDADIYSPEMTEKTYMTMVDKAAEIVSSGRHAILDASFSKKALRELVLNRAEALGKKAIFVEAKAQRETITARLKAREESALSVSDGRREILARFEAGFERPVELEPKILFEADTELDLTSSISNLFKEIVTRSFR